MKQETHEEAAERLSELQEATYTVQHKITYKHGFIDGANWQQERMYSEEDMKACWTACLDFNKPAGFDNGVNFDDFIKQFKKK